MSHLRSAERTVPRLPLLPDLDRGRDLCLLPQLVEDLLELAPLGAGEFHRRAAGGAGLAAPGGDVLQSHREFLLAARARNLHLHFGHRRRSPYLFHSNGKYPPGTPGSRVAPHREAARDITGSRPATRSSASGRSTSSGTTPACSRLLPSGMMMSAMVMLEAKTIPPILCSKLRDIMTAPEVRSPMTFARPAICIMRANNSAAEADSLSTITARRPS